MSEERALKGQLRKKKGHVIGLGSRRISVHLGSYLGRVLGVSPARHQTYSQMGRMVAAPSLRPSTSGLGSLPDPVFLHFFLEMRPGAARHPGTRSSTFEGRVAFRVARGGGANARSHIVGASSSIRRGLRLGGEFCVFCEFLPLRFQMMIPIDNIPEWGPENSQNTQNSLGVISPSWWGRPNGRYRGAR
jgi:hypothetical protein